MTSHNQNNQSQQKKLPLRQNVKRLQKQGCWHLSRKWRKRNRICKKLKLKKRNLKFHKSTKMQPNKEHRHFKTNYARKK